MSPKYDIMDAMFKERSQDDIKQSIHVLLEEAERIARTQSRMQADNFGRTPSGAPPDVPQEDIQKHLDGLDVLISEEATMALRAEFMRFSSIFDTDKSRDTIRAAVSDVTRPLIQAWIDKHMPDIARKAVNEAIGKIANVGQSGREHR